MVFLGNVVQRLCFVILVGQRVLGRAADRRALETYHHAEAIFGEVAALHHHLVQQDRQLSRGISLMPQRDRSRRPAGAARSPVAMAVSVRGH